MQRKAIYLQGKNDRASEVGFGFLVLWFLIEYLRPQEYLPFLGAIRPGLLVSLVLFVLWVPRATEVPWSDPILRGYIAFCAVMFISGVNAVNHYWWFNTQLLMWLIFVAAVIPSMLFLQTPDRLRRFFRIWLVTHLFIAVQAIRSGGVGVGGFLGDENDLALTLNVSLPYFFFLYKSPCSSKMFRALCIISVPLIIIAVISTGSRGGFVGLMTVLFGVVLFSKNKLKAVAAMFLMSVVVFPFVSSEYFDDVQTITDTSEGTASHRLYMWRRGTEMFLEHPIVGVGAGNYPWVVESYEIRSDEYDPNARTLGGRPAHSLYFTLIPELGAAGVIIFLTMVVNYFRRLRKIRIACMKSTEDADATERGLLASAMMVSLSAYLVCGSFISVLYYPHFWILAGLIIAIERNGTAMAVSGLSQAANHIDSSRPGS